ncbi:MAG: hypothetical protein ACRDQX_03845 [Pseudonocardiaceae bacterium]
MTMEPDLGAAVRDAAERAGSATICSARLSMCGKPRTGHSATTNSTPPPPWASLVARADTPREPGARCAPAAVRTSPAAVAQVWCHGARQAHLARTLAGVAAPPLDLDTGKRLGLLLGATGSYDVVDAHVASLAQVGDRVLASDPDGLRRSISGFLR